jgi:hypothetical protein
MLACGSGRMAGLCQCLGACSKGQEESRSWDDPRTSRQPTIADGRRQTADGGRQTADNR